MYKPLISIIIPVYNVEKYLELCINSVLNQDYDNYEVILIDDGSTDLSPQICDSYAPNSKINVIHKVNAGVGEARNTGLDIARGEYIFFLDSDDTILPDTLSLFVDFINNNGDINIIGIGFKSVDIHNRMAPAKVTGPNMVFNNIHDVQHKFLLRSLVILAPGTFYNIEWMKKNELRFKKIPYSEDQLFMWEALSKAKRVGYINITLYNYLHRQGSIMRATKFDKIVSSYPYFKQLQEQFSTQSDIDSLTRRFMLSRWVVGIFHSAAKLCSFDEYMEMLERCEGDFHIKNAQKFPDCKIKILTVLYRISCKLYYHINRLI